MSALFAAGFAVSAFFFTAGKLGDNSFLWHLRTGHLILDSGIPHGDPYSFTAEGVSWVGQSWLVEAFYALVDDLGGGSALRIVVSAIAAGIAAVLFLTTSRVARDRVRGGLITVVALFPTLLVYNERPLGLALLFLAILVWSVELPDSWMGRHPYVLLALFWVWANVHGTWALGVAYLVWHVAGRWMEGAPPTRGRERQLGILAIAALAVSVLSPFGLENTLFPLRLVTRADATLTIIEWNSPSFHDRFGYAFAVWLAVLLVAWTRGRRPGIRDMAMGIVFVLLALWALRNISVAVVVTAPLVARAVARDQERPDVLAPRLHAVLLATLAGFAALAVADIVVSEDYDLGAFSVGALDELGTAEWDDMRVVTSDGDAAYVIWRQWPDRTVFFDDRVDMYPIRVVDDYRTLSRVQDGWAEVLDDYQIDAVVWPTDRALAQALAASPGWDLVDEIDDASIFVRAGEARPS